MIASTKTCREQVKNAAVARSRVLPGEGVRESDREPCMQRPPVGAIDPFHNFGIRVNPAVKTTAAWLEPQLVQVPLTHFHQGVGGGKSGRSHQILKGRRGILNRE